MQEIVDLFSNSLIASLLISIAIALVGSVMLINRYGYLAASIAHGSYGGVGAAIYLGTSVLLGSTIFALVLATILAYITYKNARHLDISIGVLWAAGMSVGIILSNLAPGYHTDLLAYLFGDILMVPASDLLFMAIVDLLAFIFVSIFFHHILAIAYDKEFAKLRGVWVGTIHTLTLMLIALTVVMSIRAVGLILVIALFSIPPFVAERFTKNFGAMMLLSGVLAQALMLAGLGLAYIFDISATATIILIAAVIYFLSLLKGER